MRGVYMVDFDFVVQMSMTGKFGVFLHLNLNLFDKQLQFAAN